MPFSQTSLVKSFNQERDIFDVFVYRTDDDINTVKSSGYFEKSRYIDDPGWAGGIIQVLSSNGYSLFQINEDGESVSDNTAFLDGAVYFVGDPIGGDDATSATANRIAIQNALNEANAAGGGTVFLKSGTYYVNGDASNDICLVPYGNIRFVGAGHGSTIIKIATSETGPVSVVENLTTIDNFEISHMQIDGNRDRVPSTQWGVLEHEGVDLKSPTNCFIHHLYVHHCGTDAIDIDQPDSCIVSDCIVEDNGGCGVHGNGQDCTVSKIISKRNSWYRLQSTQASVRLAAGSISFSGSRHIFSEINSFQDERAISLEDPTRCVVSNVTVYQPGAGSNITGTTEIDPVTNNYSLTNTVSGGTAPTGGGCGIYINQGTQSTIEHCNIEMRSGLVCNA